MQLVTYSGHAPFILPEHLKEVSFSSDIPEKMGDYITTARYTDRAIGKFVEYLKTLPQYKETLIVITGDHEGLAYYRTELCESPSSVVKWWKERFRPIICTTTTLQNRNIRKNTLLFIVQCFSSSLNRKKKQTDGFRLISIVFLETIS